MAELTEQQKHLQQVLEQQGTISQEVQQLSNALENKKSMFTKLQGVREYLEQIGVTLPDPEPTTISKLSSLSKFPMATP